MGFKVYGYKSEPFDEFRDGDRYRVIERGALEIWHEGSRVLYRWSDVAAIGLRTLQCVSTRRTASHAVMGTI